MSSSDIGFHWNKEDYFPYLLQNDKTSVLALEYLVDDLHNGKDDTIDVFLTHCGSEDFLWSLVRLMSYTDARTSGNSAYILGTIAETDNGILRIIELLNNTTNVESKNVLPYLIKMLKSNDDECLMNAAGTIGTISENKAGRDWLLSHEDLDQVISSCVCLVDNANLWVSSNAALVLARISIEEIGTKKLLNHTLRESILKKLIMSLGSDDAGRGMNCAFTIGRLCDSDEGRQAFLSLKIESNKMIGTLIGMIEQAQDLGCTKNACFALSCLAGNKDAHAILINHSQVDTLIESLLRLTLKSSDNETQWFAAMHLRVIASLPGGCMKLRKHKSLNQTLKALSVDLNACPDVKSEVNLIIDLLKPLEQPNTPKVHMENSEVTLSWEPVTLKNKFHVEYLIYADLLCVYIGTNLSYKATNLQPYTQYNFKLQLITVEDGEKSPFSESVQVLTEEALPTEPLNLRCAGATTTLIKLMWDAPEHMNGLFKGYFIYNGKILIEKTSDSMYVVTGLVPKTSYELNVCASTSKGKGKLASIKASTLELGDIIPDKPTYGQIGRREILVKWNHPQVLAGKLNRYDLHMNGKCIYSGMALEYQVSLLRPDTEYKFEIVAITNEGKCKSKASKARTLKDEYDRDDRAPLYPGPAQITQIPNLLFVNNDNPLQALNKKSTQENDNRLNRAFLHRQRKKSTRRKPNYDTEESSLMNRSSLSDNSTILPPVNDPDSTLKANFQKHAPKLNNFFKNTLSLPRSITEYANDSNDVQSKSVNIIHENVDVLKPLSFSNKYPVIDRSKTMFIHNTTNTSNTRNIPKKSFVIPQVASLNIQEIQPEFPLLQTKVSATNNTNFRFMHKMKREKTLITAEDVIPSFLRSNTNFNTHRSFHVFK